MSNFLIVYPTRLLYKMMRIIIISNPMALILGRLVFRQYSINEPLHDKTNKVAVRPSKTHVSLGIRPVRSIFAVRSVGS